MKTTKVLFGTVVEIGLVQRIKVETDVAHLRDMTLTGNTRAAGAAVSDRVRLEYRETVSSGLWYAVIADRQSRYENGTLGTDWPFP